MTDCTPAQTHIMEVMHDIADAHNTAPSRTDKEYYMVAFYSLYGTIIGCTSADVPMLIEMHSVDDEFKAAFKAIKNT